MFTPPRSSSTARTLSKVDEEISSSSLKKKKTKKTNTNKQKNETDNNVSDELERCKKERDEAREFAEHVQQKYKKEREKIRVELANARVITANLDRDIEKERRQRISVESEMGAFPGLRSLLRR